jgi:hypothetical protein
LAIRCDVAQFCCKIFHFFLYEREWIFCLPPVLSDTIIPYNFLFVNRFYKTFLIFFKKFFTPGAIFQDQKNWTLSIDKVHEQKNPEILFHSKTRKNPGNL